MKRLSVLGVVSLVVMVGCQKPAERLNSPPQGDTVNRSPLQEPFAAMVDNAALADMSIADIHFAGNTARLSGTGEYRLKKLSQICKTCGGEIRYDTQLENDKLVQARLRQVEQYLTAAGCDMDNCSVRLGMAASTDMPAAQAIKAQGSGFSTSGETNGRAGIMPRLPGGPAGASK